MADVRITRDYAQPKAINIDSAAWEFALLRWQRATDGDSKLSIRAEVREAFIAQVVRFGGQDRVTNIPDEVIAEMIRVLRLPWGAKDDYACEIADALERAYAQTRGQGGYR